MDSRWQGPHGIGRFAEEMLRRLRRRPGMRVEEVSEGSPLSPLDPLRLACLLLRKRPDVFFSPGFNPPLGSPVPFVFTLHDLIHVRFPGDYTLAHRIYYRFLVRSACRRAAAVLTVSRHSQRDIARWAGISEAKIQVAPNGVGPEFSPEGPRASLGYPYLLFVGNRKPHKNLPRLLRAFAQAELSPQVRLVLSGPPERALVALAQGLGVGERVVFYGPIPEPELPPLYRGALALLLPSLYEGFGLPALEAMACGTPVLASAVAALPEVVGEAAVFVDPYRVEDIAPSIERIVEDEELRERLRHRGLEQAKKFSWERTAEQVSALLQEVAALYRG